MPLPRRHTHRHLVMKWDDLNEALTSEQMDQLIHISECVAQFRTAHGRPARNFICISDKRAELFEEVWGMFLADIHRENQERNERYREELRQHIANFNASIADGVVSRGSVSQAAAEEDVAETDSAGDENFALPASDEAPTVQHFDFETDAPVAEASIETGQFAARPTRSASAITREELNAILTASAATVAAHRQNATNPATREEAARTARPVSRNSGSAGVGDFGWWGRPVRSSLTSFDEMEASMTTAWGGRSPSE